MQRLFRRPNQMLKPVWHQQDPAWQDPTSAAVFMHPALCNPNLHLVVARPIGMPAVCRGAQPIGTDLELQGVVVGYIYIHAYTMWDAKA